MSAKDRAAIINKLHKFCKKQYEFVQPPSDRTILEHMIYACCLENSTFEAADESLARLQSEYFDWNEVRVTTTVEIAQNCKNLTDPDAAAHRIKKALHAVFETWYQWDLDFLRKDNLGKTTQTLGKFKGVSNFLISYVAQHGLGGHSIPLDESLLMLMHAIGAITEDEEKKAKVPGLERTIPKNKGIEFSTVTHHLAVAYFAHPFKKDVRETISTLAPDAKDRFPKRGAKKRAEAAAAKAAEEARLAEIAAEKEAVLKEQEAIKEAAAKKAAARKEKAAKKKAAAKKEADKKKAAAKKQAASRKKASRKKATRKKASAKRASSSSRKKPVVKKSSKKKKSPAKRLSKKKPR